MSHNKSPHFDQLSGRSWTDVVWESLHPIKFSRKSIRSKSIWRKFRVLHNKVSKLKVWEQTPKLGNRSLSWRVLFTDKLRFPRLLSCQIHFTINGESFRHYCKKIFLLLILVNNLLLGSLLVISFLYTLILYYFHIYCIHTVTVLSPREIKKFATT